MITLTCPYCGARLTSATALHGQMIKVYKEIRVKDLKCPNCYRKADHRFLIEKVSRKKRNELRCVYCERLINPGEVGYRLENKNDYIITNANCICGKNVTIRLKYKGAIRQSDIVDLFGGI